ncbi:MAG: ATP-binding cassette domain-containing protein [Bacteroidales bacterium]|nr:ATP-binding cassette domain-containing protein [Bacteroidales bacterium]
MEDRTSDRKNPIVDIENLKKSFQDNLVLEDVNLKIPKGENVVIIGQSGIGKSVLIKCMVRLIEPDDGKIEIFGQNIPTLGKDELNTVRKRIGFLFQGNALYDSMTVRENLEFPLIRNKLTKNKKDLEARIYEALDNVNLRKAIDLLPSELSGGMKKRIGLARTLILKPEIILYDEPTTGLDPITSKEISNLIINLQEKYNTTSIIITHDISCVRLTANIIHVLRNGILYKSGKYNELKKSEDPWINNFFN